LGPSSSPQRGSAPHFRPISAVAKWLHGSRYRLVWRPRTRRLCVRWGPRSRLPKNGRSPQIFGPCLLWPNGWINEDGTWHGDRPQPRRLCIRWVPSPLPKRGGAPSPIFGPFLLWPNGWMHQDATWYGSRPQHRGLCVRWGPSPHSLKRGRSRGAPNFRPMSIAAKRLHVSRCHLVWR